MSGKKLNRRHFLSASMVAAGASMTAACVMPVTPAAAPSEGSMTSESPGYMFYFNTDGSVEFSFWSAANNGFLDFYSHYNIDG